MKKFAFFGLFISLVLAVFISPFASSAPDGLEKVAETLGFIHKDMGSMLKGPFPDYTFSLIKNESLSTSFAGLIGTLSVFVISLIVGFALKKNVYKS